MEKVTREALVLKVRNGRLTPEEAEAEAASLGLGPLATSPFPEAFDPMAEADWSLPMALEWMVWRLPERVRDVWDAYRAKILEWRFEPWRDDTDGQDRSGHVLKVREPASLDRMLRSGDYADAIALLEAALRDGRVRANGSSAATGRRRKIAAHEWSVSGESSVPDAVTGDDGSKTLRMAGLLDITIRREDVVKLCPPRASRKRTLPATMPPTGPGYMPLCCAVQWIATRGGTVSFDPDDDEVWRPAFDTLLAHIASDAVSVVGVRGSERKRLDGAQFAGCQVSYPSGSIPESLMFGRELYLMSYLYLDELHWRRGFDDASMVGPEREWVQLMVSREDVARIWAFNFDVQYRSGSPGRPTSRHLVQDEFMARVERREARPTLTEEAGELALWLRYMHPRAFPMTEKSSQNCIREDFRKLKNTRK